MSPQLTGDALYDQVRLAQAHDRDALNLVCAQFLKTVWAIAFTWLRNAADADDATQNAFILVTRYISRLRDPTRIAGWIRQLTIRSLLQGQRQRRLFQLIQDEEGRLLEIESRDVYSLLEELVRRERRQVIEEVLRRLKPADAQALDLFYLQGMSCQEIASLIDSPVNTIKRRLCYARRRLRAMLLQDRRWTGHAA